jgi:hypothetical protein
MKSSRTVHAWRLAPLLTTLLSVLAAAAQVGAGAALAAADGATLVSQSGCNARVAVNAASQTHASQLTQEIH